MAAMAQTSAAVEPAVRQRRGYSFRSSVFNFGAEAGDTDAQDSAPRRFQRGGRRKALIEEENDEGTQAAKVHEALSSKSIAISQLIYFYNKKEGQSKLSAESTCFDVLRNVIMPETESQQCCYLDTMLGSTKEPDVFVSHWMGLNFRELVISVVQHSSGNVLCRSTLERKAFNPQGLCQHEVEKAYWIGLFAANFQKRDSPGHPIGDVETLTTVLEAMNSVLVVFDQGMVIGSRTWCLFELFQTGELAIDLEFGGVLGDRFRADALPLVPLESTDTHDPRDKVKLIQELRESGNISECDHEVQEMLAVGAFYVLWRVAMREQDVSAMEALLDKGADVDWEVTGNDTALSWACQYSSNCMVEMLLKRGASVNPSHVGAWSPLHFAVQLGNEAGVLALLRAFADPNWAAQNGRTPLIDASERGYKQIVELLLEAGASAETADNEGLLAASFAEQLEDAELQERLGWDPMVHRASVKRMSTMR